jgi:hypothetical protein
LIAVSWRQWASLKKTSSHQPAALRKQAVGFLVYMFSICFGTRRTEAASSRALGAGEQKLKDEFPFLNEATLEQENLPFTFPFANGEAKRSRLKR